MLRRRHFLIAGGGALALMAIPRLVTGATVGIMARTDAEWRALLTPEQFAVLRQAQTEQPYSSPLTAEKRRGIYACGGCGRGWIARRSSAEAAVATWDTCSAMVRHRPACAIA